MSLLDRAAYTPLWAAARRRLETNGLSLGGAPLTLKGLTSEESDAVAGLLGIRRPAGGTPLRVPLVTLDRALRSSSIEEGLLGVLTRLGGPVVDRRAAKASKEAEQATQWAEAYSHAAVQRDGRLAGWLDQVKSTGLDRRLAGAGGVVVVIAALDVLAVLNRDSNHRLPVLAAEVARDSHALDRGQPIGTLVVHALTWFNEEAFPQDAADWRRVWADAGVACDDLSCDVLVLNLPGFAKEPLRLTLRQVTTWRPPAVVRGQVFACENPAVVAAASDRLGDSSPPLVCVDGMPSTAALIVLARLAEHGQRIFYHGDFDWRGLAIANVVARKLPMTTPWRYNATDYKRAIAAGLGTVELTGRLTASPWDAGLAKAMESAGFAIYEEQVLSELLDDLDRSRG
ncbi:MAG TPA: TIGR02679 family protein [Acidimicrobiales bacterium]